MGIFSSKPAITPPPELKRDPKRLPGDYEKLRASLSSTGTLLLPDDTGVRSDSLVPSSLNDCTMHGIYLRHNRDVTAHAPAIFHGALMGRMLTSKSNSTSLPGQGAPGTTTRWEPPRAFCSRAQWTMWRLALSTLQRIRWRKAPPAFADIISVHLPTSYRAICLVSWSHLSIHFVIDTTIRPWFSSGFCFISYKSCRRSSFASREGATATSACSTTRSSATSPCGQT